MIFARGSSSSIHALLPWFYLSSLPIVTGFCLKTRHIFPRSLPLPLLSILLPTICSSSFPLVFHILSFISLLLYPKVPSTIVCPKPHHLFTISLPYLYHLLCSWPTEGGRERAWDVLAICRVYVSFVFSSRLIDH